MPVKDKKKSSGGEKPLTAFFARAPKASSPKKTTTKPSLVTPAVVQSTTTSTSTTTPSQPSSMKAPTTPRRKVSRKRSRSPESHPMNNFSSDAGQTSSVPSTPNRPEKKLRRSPRLNPPCRATPFVPSSQSDEEELPAMEVSQPSMKQKLVSESKSSPFSSGGSSAIPSSHVSPAMSASSNQPLSVPATPVALDAAAKTARLIEEIKRRAYETTHSSPEPTPQEFNDVLEDDSDDDDVPFPLLPVARPTKLETDNGSSNRYALRKRNSSPTQPMKINKQISPTLAPQKKKPNPFDALLKEKKHAEKHGVGNEAIRRADAIAKNMAQFKSMVDVDDEFDEDEVDSLQGTDALNLAIQSKDLFGPKPKRKRGGDDDEPRDTGNEIVSILERDVAIKEEDAQLQRPTGLHLWLDSSSSLMDVDTAAPSYQLSGESDIATIVNPYLARGDDLSLDAFLRTDSYMAMETNDLSEMFQRVMDWGLMPCEGAMNERLQSAVEMLSMDMKAVFPFSRMLGVLQQLGADPAILTAQGWTLPSVPPLSSISPEDREDVIFRLTNAIDACARNQKLAVDELPSFVIALLIVALDESTASDNQQDVIRLLDSICNSGLEHSREMELCSKVLTFVRTLAPSIQCSIVLLLAQGTNITRTLANYIAYCIIVDQSHVEPSTYSDKPPIDNIRVQFQRIPDYPTKFVVREETDYVNLGFYTTILGIAVSDVRGYVSQERQEAKKAPVEADHSTVKSSVGLKALRDDLETLHSKISDARATHLERSRTKGSIKALSMNLHYQREIWTKNDAENKTKTLAQYFRKK